MQKRNSPLTWRYFIGIPFILFFLTLNVSGMPADSQLIKKIKNFLTLREVNNERQAIIVVLPSKRYSQKITHEPRGYIEDLGSLHNIHHLILSDIHLSSVVIKDTLAKNKITTNKITTILKEQYPQLTVSQYGTLILLRDNVNNVVTDTFQISKITSKATSQEEIIAYAWILKWWDNDRFWNVPFLTFSAFTLYSGIQYIIYREKPTDLRNQLANTTASDPKRESLLEEYGGAKARKKLFKSMLITSAAVWSIYFIKEYFFRFQKSYPKSPVNHSQTSKPKKPPKLSIRMLPEFERWHLQLQLLL